MTLHETILERLRDFELSHTQNGVLDDQQYYDLVLPLHQALLELAKVSVKNPTFGIVSTGPVKDQDDRIKETSFKVSCDGYEYSKPDLTIDPAKRPPRGYME